MSSRELSEVSLANGSKILAGQAVYKIDNKGEITVHRVIKILDYNIKDIHSHYVFHITDDKKPKDSFFERAINKTIFLKRKDALLHSELKKLNIEKRNLLKKYEKELNEKLGLTTLILK